MLKFLTHKLRTHSLNEDQPDHFKADDDHDSGTESDDDQGEEDDPEGNMESETETGSTETNCSPASLYFPDSALASDSDHNCDHHSSEEELEVINSSSNSSVKIVNELLTTCRTGSVTLPEKRKWSQITGGSSAGGGLSKGPGHCERVMIASAGGATIVATLAEHSSGSSDEEVQGLLAAMATPLQFRSSPPSSARKPGHRSLSPPPKLFHYEKRDSASAAAATLEVSPRKKHRHTARAHHIQRPCLDFEKMQQLKARAVTAWRHSGDHGGGELSVFCW